MRICELNFVQKSERTLSAADLMASPPSGIFYWIVLDADDEAAGRELLAKLNVPINDINDFLGSHREALYELRDSSITFSVSEAPLEAGVLRRVIITWLLGAGFFCVRSSEPSSVIAQMLKLYKDDFLAFAKSPGFLLFELAAQLFESYRRTFHNFAIEVEKTQLALFGTVSDDIFRDVSQLTAELLAFRRMVLGSRDLFKELATRKSTLIGETTQPALELLSDRMERLGDDLDSERTVLTETLNLYMGMVSHRTNRVVNRLTIFSMIFLPLSFVCGVYGMNFERMPELGWRYGYLAFWAFATVFVISFVVYIKRKKWI